METIKVNENILINLTKQKFYFANPETNYEVTIKTKHSVAQLLFPQLWSGQVVPLRVPQLCQDLPLVAPRVVTVGVLRGLLLRALLPCNTMTDQPDALLPSLCIEHG